MIPKARQNPPARKTVFKPRALFSAPVACIAALCLCGCLGRRPHNPAATQPVTVGDPATATPQYWLQQPAVDEVTAGELPKLITAAEDVAHDYLFKIDRRDFRGGELVTDSMISKQWFEPWRKDAGTWDDVKESSIGPIRRTIYFQFAQNLDGTYTVTPKVLVERYARVESKYAPIPPAESEQPMSYWYALRRDTVLESRIAESLRRKLK